MDETWWNKDGQTWSTGRTTHLEAHVTVAVSGHNIGLGFGSRKELRARAAHLALAIRAAASRRMLKNAKNNTIFDCSISSISSMFFKSLHMFICPSKFVYIIQGSSCNVPVEFTGLAGSFMDRNGEFTWRLFCCVWPASQDMPGSSLNAASFCKC